MNYTQIPNECSRCGAPLTQKGEELFCEYCGHKYSLIPLELETAAIEKQQEENYTPDVNEEPSKTIEQPQEERIRITLTTPNRRRKAQNSGVDSKKVVLVLFLAIIFCGVTPRLLPKIFNKHTTTSTTSERAANDAAAVETTHSNKKEEKPSLIELIRQEEYHWVAYPSASNEDLPVATSVVLDYADANTLKFSLFVYNQSEKDIDTSSLEEHLEIDSLAVTSDLKDEFTCFLQKENWDEDLFLPNRIQRKGLITCTGSLDPESSSIIIDFDMPNWGSSHLQIPIYANDTDLKAGISLELERDSNRMTIEFNSKKPQLIWVKKSDIIISDEQGKKMLLDGCTPTTSQHGKGEYFLTLTYPSNNYSNLIKCRYDEPFPSEINILSAVLKTTTEKTFTSKAIINKSVGLIEFTDQTVEDHSDDVLP